MITLKNYRIEYASGMLLKNGKRQTQLIYSDEELKENDFIVVEHKDCGLFLGRVVEDVTSECELESDEEIIDVMDYKYISKVDLTDYFAAIEKAKRKAELKTKMISQFRKIDEEKKYQYYAELDEDFRKIYEEYKSID